MSNIIAIILIVLYSTSCFSSSNKKQNKSEQVNENCVGIWDSTLNKEVFTFVEIMPKYNGSSKGHITYFWENFNMRSNQNEVQKSINLMFIIDIDGKVKEVKVANKKENDELTSIEVEAIKVLENMPKWEPGRCDGQKVAVRISFPIRL